MDLITIILYAVLLLFVLAYAGVIVYHIIRYRIELPPTQSRYVTLAMIIYVSIGAVLIASSIIVAIFLAV